MAEPDNTNNNNVNMNAAVPPAPPQPPAPVVAQPPVPPPVPGSVIAQPPPPPIMISTASNTTGWLSISTNQQTGLPEASVTLRVTDLVQSVNILELNNMIEIIKGLTIIKRLHIKLEDHDLGFIGQALVPLIEAYVYNQHQLQRQMNGAVLKQKRELIVETPFGNQELHDFLVDNTSISKDVKNAITQLWVYCNTTTKGISHRKRSIRALAAGALPNCYRLRIMGSYSVQFVKDFATTGGLGNNTPIPALSAIKIDGIASSGQMEPILQVLAANGQLTKVEIPIVYNLEAAQLLVDFWNKLNKTRTERAAQETHLRFHQEDDIAEVTMIGTGSSTSSSQGWHEHGEERDQLNQLKGGIDQLHIHRIDSIEQAKQMVSILRAHPSINKIKVKESTVDAAQIWLQYIQKERMTTSNNKLEFADKEEIRLIAPSTITTETNTTDEQQQQQQQTYWEVGALYHDFTGMGFHATNPWGLGIIPEGYDEKIALEETARATQAAQEEEEDDDVTTEQPPRPRTVLDIEVDKLVQLITSIMSKGVVYVTLSKNETRSDYWKRVALPLIAAASTAKTEEIALHLGFHNPQCLQLLNQPIVRNSVTFIEPWDEMPPPTTIPTPPSTNDSAVNDVATTISLLNKLKTLMLCGAPQPLLHWLATQVNFHPALRQLDLWDVRTEMQIREVKTLLQNNPSIKGFDMYDSSSDWEPSFPHYSVLDLLMKNTPPTTTDGSGSLDENNCASSDSIQLEKFSFHTKRNGAVTDSIITTISSIFGTNQLSPTIKCLDMSFGVDIPTKNQLKANLLPALEQNTQTNLKLEDFTLKLYDSIATNSPTDVAGHGNQVLLEDELLTTECKAFALQKTMERVAASIGQDNNKNAGDGAADGSGGLPLTALPNAVNAMRNNPQLVQSMNSNKRGIITTNMIWQGLKRKIATDRAIGSALFKLGKRMMTAVVPTSSTSASTTTSTSSTVGTITTTTITSGTFHKEVDC